MAWSFAGIVLITTAMLGVLWCGCLVLSAFSGRLKIFQDGLVRMLVERCRYELRLPVPGAAAVSPVPRLALELDYVVALGMRILVQHGYVALRTD